jgi:hypothetical protein
VTEKQFQRQVTDLAHKLGWASYHTYLSIRSAPGFPDLVLARAKPNGDGIAGRVLFRELKTDRGKLTDQQEGWLDLLNLCGQNARVWRPADWESIVEELR